MKTHRAASRPIVAVGLVFLSACGDETWPVGVGGGGGGDAGTTAPSYAWALPEGFPLPVVPADNPMSAEKVKLGRYLFYDKRLSGNEKQSCADCHKQDLAFTDGRATALGSTGQAHPRNAMSLVNVGYASTLTWANPLQRDLEHQALVPMFGDDPVELGLTSQGQIEDRLRGVSLYSPLFQDAWPGDEQPITLNHVAQALASFERTIVSGRSPFDRFQYNGDASAISDAAKRGYKLFNSETMECFHCHVGFDLTDHVNWADKVFFDQPYHNTGLYNLNGTGDYPEPNTGVYHVTKNAPDMGRFKAPTLRNIALTAPYMHDGSIATLEAVLDHYQAGGRTLPDGPYAGNGSLNPYKDPIIRALDLTPQQRADAIEFLKSLTDDELLHAPELASPF
jgi:cytochrome c peroxidase